jgi:hypothetical protein
VSRLAQWFDLTVWTVPPLVTALDAVHADEPVFGEIVEVRGHRLGSIGGAPFIALVRLADGRWCYANFTARDAESMTWVLFVASTRDRLWWFACTDEDRERFTPQLTREDLEDELVRIDELLESGDSETRAIAERRAHQRASSRSPSPSNPRRRKNRR